MKYKKQCSVVAIAPIKPIGDNFCNQVKEFCSSPYTPIVKASIKTPITESDLTFCDDCSEEKQFEYSGPGMKVGLGLKRTKSFFKNLLRRKTKTKVGDYRIPMLWNIAD
jgi:hypothetical protein